MVEHYISVIVLDNIKNQTVMKQVLDFELKSKNQLKHMKKMESALD